MLIFYGIKSLLLKTVQALGFKCKNCQTSGTIYVSMFQTYVHIFWIPCFPVGKNFVSVCTHCKQTLQKKDMPEELMTIVKSQTSNIRTPWYTFAGIVITFLLIGAGIYHDINKAKISEQLIAQPTQGDIYELVQDNGKYTFIKVLKTEKDIVTFQISNYEWDGNPDEGEVDFAEAGFFFADEYDISTEELQTMYKNHKITDVVRK